jgi:polyphosphate kinase
MHSESFFDRDLSWLSFNGRVLEEAGSDSVPLLERIKFLSIYSSNLDEFYRVRMPAVMALQKIRQSKGADHIKEQVKTDVLRTYQNFKLYKRSFAASVDQLQAADMAFSLEKERYELGVTSFVDFITANKNLVQAQTDRAQAQYRLLFQKVLMDYATGTLKPEDLN